MTDLTNEMGVIGSILRAPETISVAAETVSPDDFSVESYRVTYEAALSLYREGKAIDPIEIRKEARRLDPSAAMTSEAMIALIEITPTAANIGVHSKGLRNEANMRRIRAILESAAFEGNDPDEVIDTVVDQLSAIQKGGGRRISATLREMMDEYTIWLSSSSKDTGLNMGYPRLDTMLGGMSPGDLVLLAARPGVGKSALAGNVALRTARQGKPVVVFSAEMSKLQFSQRFMASETGVDLDEIMSREAKEGESGRAQAAAVKELKAYPLHVYDHPGITLHDIRREMQRLKGIQLVVVDYIQILDSTGRSENRNLEIAKLSGGLKKLAKEFGVPVLALSQLNRGKDETDEPGLTDLRDSGSLEQDADKAIFAWKLEQPEPGELTKIGVKVAKNRMGQTGAVVMYFDGAHMRYKETAEEYVPKKRGYGRQFQKVGDRDPDFPKEW